MRTLNNISPRDWVSEFSDWSEMSLKPTIELYEDYVLVPQTNWFQLLAEFGGAPSIMFFIIDS